MKISGKRLLHSLIAVTGFLLSPLSWWNDVIINIPLAYLFSFPFTRLNEHLFLPAFICGYWLTNILGFVLLHKGLRGLFHKEQRAALHLKRDVLVSLGYTVIIVIFGLLGWVKPPTAYLHH